MSTLDNLAKLFGKDKSSEIHNYCVKYEKYLLFNRYDLREGKLIPYSNKVQLNCKTDIESINFLNGIILITKQ